MQVKMAIRIYDDTGGKAFGSGVAELLRKIESTGSLNKAAKEMELAYSKAWKILDVAEQKLGIVLVDRTIGGQHGGGSRLTQEGLRFLEKYEAFAEKSRVIVEALFRETF